MVPIVTRDHPDRDPDSGQFESDSPDDALIDFIRSAQNCSSGDVADEFGFSRRNALERLRGLEADGKLDSEKIGNTNVWTVATDE